MSRAVLPLVLCLVWAGHAMPVARGQDVQLERQATSALRQGARAWQRFVAEQRGRGAGSASELVIVLSVQQAEIVRQLEPVRKRYDQLAALRVSLDRARQHALELIRDEDVYFYPYDPAEVGVEAAAKYAAVQKEVDARVDAVRELWEGKGAAVRLTASQGRQLERFRWVRAAVVEFAGQDAELDAEAEWIPLLPAGRRLSIQEFCADQKERDQLELYQRMDTFTENAGEPLTPAERKLVALTNAYRRMLGLHPLALNAKLIEAASGHAGEMSSMGYFSHASPTPGRRTERDRALAAGYPRWSGENIQFGRDTAAAALHGWARSSVHHRNLLSPRSWELGVGNAGRYWVQDFGAAKEFREHPDFPPAGDR